MASFLPLFFLDGMEGKMLKPLGISFIVALIASTIVALTVTLVLCSYLLGSAKAMKAIDKEPKFARMLRGAYEKCLRWSFGHAKGIFIATALMFAVSVGIFFTLGRSFLPSFNEGSLTINVSSLRAYLLRKATVSAAKQRKSYSPCPRFR